MSVMAETHQSAMGPYFAMAEAAFELNSVTAAFREALVVKVASVRQTGSGLFGGGGEGLGGGDGGGEGGGGGGLGDGGGGLGDRVPPVAMPTSTPIIKGFKSGWSATRTT